MITVGECLFIGSKAQAVVRIAPELYYGSNLAAERASLA
jgi:hypothetical protein